MVQASWLNNLETELTRWQQSGLTRRLREVQSAPGTQIVLEGRPLLNFSSNDYLGLGQHPALRQAAIQAVERFGTTAAASRLICGTLTPHRELEEALADWKQAPAALSFNSGYSTALGVLTTVLGREDIVILDKQVHACCVDAARMSGASLRVFPHNNLDALERVLKWADQRNSVRRPAVWIVTESVFSMDGDRAPLKELVVLKERYGACLFLDEAHATGLFGANRSGLAAACELSDRIEIQMGTLGKALASGGGYVVGPRVLIDALMHRARSFLYSTAPPPATAAAAGAAVEILRGSEGEDRCRVVWERATRLLALLKELAAAQGLPKDGLPQSPGSAILPWIVGDESRAVALAGYLLDAGVFLPAIRYPTVARRKARLRFSVSAAHTDNDLDQLAIACHKAFGHFVRSTP